MRVTRGRWRGRALRAPEGRSTRPTQDRVREAIGSMVEAAFGLDLSGVSVLDAFAGSGAVGIELLSRGARHVTLVEQDRAAFGVLTANLRALGAPRAEASAVRSETLRAARGRLPGAPFSVVFLDPPYAQDPALSASVAQALDASGQLAPDALLVHERELSAEPIAVEGFEVYRTKRHGSSAVELLRRVPVPKEAL